MRLILRCVGDASPLTHLSSVVAIAMAEICSAYPTSGGLYYWAARLGGNHRVFASWVTGWFNLLGQVAITAGVGSAFPCVRATPAMR